LYKLEAEVTEARAQLRDDVIKTADDLRARVHNMFAAASAEMREMIEAQFVALSERPFCKFRASASKLLL
jgi:hypothetical protein